MNVHWRDCVYVIPKGNSSRIQPYWKILLPHTWRLSSCVTAWPRFKCASWTPPENHLAPEPRELNAAALDRKDAMKYMLFFSFDKLRVKGILHILLLKLVSCSNPPLFLREKSKDVCVRVVYTNVKI